MENYRLNQLTHFKWLNLFELNYLDKGKARQWILCSRKSNPVVDAHKPDAVFIVPIVQTAHGSRLVVIREFRPALWDWEYAFPAGLIDDNEDPKDTIRRELKEETGLDLKEIVHMSMPVYSSSGMSDESCLMAFVIAHGQLKPKRQDDEHIEPLLMDVSDIKDLLHSNHKIAGKAWGILYHFATVGRINF